MSNPRRWKRGAAFAPHVGLVGAALQQALSACLVQVYGEDAVYWGEHDRKSSR